MDDVFSVQKFDRSAQLFNYWLSLFSWHSALFHFGEQSFCASELLDEAYSLGVVENPIKFDYIDVIAILLDFELGNQPIDHTQMLQTFLLQHF